MGILVGRTLSDFEAQISASVQLFSASVQLFSASVQLISASVQLFSS